MASCSPGHRHPIWIGEIWVVNDEGSKIVKFGANIKIMKLYL